MGCVATYRPCGAHTELAITHDAFVCVCGGGGGVQRGLKPEYFQICSGLPMMNFKEGGFPSHILRRLVVKIPRKVISIAQAEVKPFEQ